MARTLVDVDDQALAAARDLFGTRTKVDTVNTALREVVRLHRLTAQLDRDENPFADAPNDDEAWR